MAIQQSLTLPDTGVQDQQAYGQITDATLILSQLLTSVTLNWWWNQADGTLPVPLKTIRTDNVTIASAVLTTPNPAFTSALDAQIQSGAIKTPLDALKAALYILVTQQPAYSSAVQV